MKLCCIVSTYGRPQLLPRVIACFEAQDYEDRCMVILDDGGQYGPCEGDRWKLFSVPDRFQSLGAKRNQTLALVPHDTDAILPTDDDDLFLPWHLSATAAALENAEWSRPSVILTAHTIGDMWLFVANLTGHPLDQRQNRLYHPAWGMRLDMVRRLGGYPNHMSGPEDRDLMQRMEAAGVTTADPIELGFPPSYVYIWGQQNISGLLTQQDQTGNIAWSRLARTLSPVTLEKWTPPFDIRHPIMAPGIRKRPF